MHNNQKVLVLGATGSIGGAVADILRQRGHHVTCLARSDQSEKNLHLNNFNTIRGDIRQPDKWVKKVRHYDAVIQAAATWSDDMGKVDEQLVLSIIDEISSSGPVKTLIYTGGCWLYGNTGNTAATEKTVYDSLPSFEWMTDVGQRVCAQKNIRGMVIHPAMVYERDGGVLERMITDIKNLGQIRVNGSQKTRWTMVHRLDLAELYALALEKGDGGENYNGAGIESVEVCQIARTLARRFKIPSEPILLSLKSAIAEWGDSATGYALDQKMSSEKAINQLGWKPKYTDILTELS